MKSQKKKKKKILNLIFFPRITIFHSKIQISINLSIYCRFVTFAHTGNSFISNWSRFPDCVSQFANEFPNVTYIYTILSTTRKPVGILFYIILFGKFIELQQHWLTRGKWLWKNFTWGRDFFFSLFFYFSRENLNLISRLWEWNESI